MYTYNNKVFVWRFNSSGEFGREDNTPIPDTSKELLDDVKCLYKRDGSNCVAILKNDGTLYYSGTDHYNILGEPVKNYNEPVEVEKDVKDVLFFDEGILILKNNGEVVRYYVEYYFYNVPKGYAHDIPMTDVKEIFTDKASGYPKIAFVLCNDGSVWGMGSNYSRALGVEDVGLEFVYEPVKCEFLSQHFKNTNELTTNEQGNIITSDTGSDPFKFIHNKAWLLTLLSVTLILALIKKLHH